MVLIHRNVRYLCRREEKNESNTLKYSWKTPHFGPQDFNKQEIWRVGYCQGIPNTVIDKRQEDPGYLLDKKKKKSNNSLI